VEIDPVIQGLGALDHPMAPYADPRVTVHLDDGRNFLHTTTRRYDLVVYALVDSLVLHSGYSNIRLESYLFTRQAFEDIHRRLKPGGMVVTYNYFRQGWIVARLTQELEQAFGRGNPLVFTWPDLDRVDPESGFSGFSVVFAGDGAERLRRAFYRTPGAPPREYWLAAAAPGPDTPNGFGAATPEERARWKGLTGAERAQASSGWWRFLPAEVVAPAEPLREATDDWPFLYLRAATIPDLTLRGMAVMGALALGLLLVFQRRGGMALAGRGPGGWEAAARFFFLGAGFMLVETKAVVHMALLFGSTWVVNSVVFFAVLVMILGANLFVLRWRPRNLAPYAIGLLLSLGASALVPIDRLLGLGRALQVAGSFFVVFTPILFAGVIFAVSLARTGRPDRAFGANIAGAMLGGLSENTSMLLGFQHLVLVAFVFYVLAIVFRPGSLGAAAAPSASREAPEGS
jgi:hypothetical protein